MRYAIISLILLLLLIIVFFVKAILFVPNFNTEKMMLNSVFGIALLRLYLIIRVYYLIRKDEDLVRSADRIR